MKCECCNKNNRDVRELLYKDALSSIRENGHFKKLPVVLVERIIDTAFIDKVTICWQVKDRCRCHQCLGYTWPPVVSTSDSDSDSNDYGSDYSDENNDYCENDGYIYRRGYAELCTRCFLEGINRVLRSTNSLPFLRFHSNAFFNKIPVEIDPYKYIIPSEYNITYYRRKNPVKNQDGRLVITSS